MQCEVKTYTKRIPKLTYETNLRISFMKTFPIANQTSNTLSSKQHMYIYYKQTVHKSTYFSAAQEYKQ